MVDEPSPSDEALEPVRRPGPRPRAETPPPAEADAVTGDPMWVGPAQAPEEDRPTGPTRRRLLAGGVATVALLAGGAAFAWSRREGEESRPDGAWTLRPYSGLGAWVDAYDWTAALGGDAPAVTPASMAEMAAAGTQTVFLQTAHNRIDGAVSEPERLQPLLDAAHDAGLHVVAWYLPTLTGEAADLSRLEAALDLDVDGLAVDIEAVTEPDPALRTARLLELSEALRTQAGEKVLGAITLSPIHVQVVNPAFWPGYPFAELAALYDVALPMAYWTIRKGDLADGAAHTAQELQRVRTSMGADLPIHLIGGLAEDATVADITEMVDALLDAGALGGSLYDWATSTPAQWAALRPLAGLRTD